MFLVAGHTPMSIEYYIDPLGYDGSINCCKFLVQFILGHFIRMKNGTGRWVLWTPSSSTAGLLGMSVTGDIFIYVFLKFRL